MAVLHANRVVACSRAAAAAGVRVGHRRREAQSRCPALDVVAHEPARDARAFHDVIEAVAAAVPRLELTEPGVLTFATRGPSRYFGGDAALAAHVRTLVESALGTALRAVGPVGIGIADGRFAAGVAAHRAMRQAAAGGDGWVIVPAAGSATFLARGSLQWLIHVGGVEPDLVGLFRRLGLRDLGALAALPIPDVLARFGQPGVIAHQMAAAGDDRPPGTQDPPEGMVFVHHFDAPVHHLESLVFVGKHLADQLASALAAQGRVCTQMLVTAETEHGERTERCWSRSTGLSAAAMVERIRWQLDGWGQGITGDAGGGAVADAAGGEGGERGGGGEDGVVQVDVTAGVIQLRVEPLAVRADEGVQLGLWGGRTQADEWAQRATARLVGLVGDPQVVVPAWQGGRHPDDVYRWVSASLSDLDDPTGRAAPGPGAATGPWPGLLPAPSPAAVYPSAVEASVVDADGRHVGVSGRGVASGAPARVRCAGRDEEVAAWAGPWVVEERWWDAGRHRRVARYQLLTQSGRAYLAVLERQRWWLVAEYA